MNDNRIKICHVQLLPIMSGVQRAMLTVLSQLDRQRFSITVICKEEGELTANLQTEGIAWKTIPDLVRPIHPWRDFLAFWKLVRYYRQQKFDIVHSHSSKTGFLSRAAARVAGVPLVFHTMHGLPFHEFSSCAKVAFYAAAERMAGYFSNEVIFVNNEERELVIRKKILPADKVVTIYNGVDLNQIRLYNTPEVRIRCREKWQIGTDDFVVGYVGRLWEQKDPETLLNTIELCRDLPVRFLIAGDGPFKELFDRRFKDDKRVILTGWLNDPLAIYSAIDTLILPSLWEGLSLTLIEAMAFGKPLIASNIKGNRECVWDGENGFLCPPRNPNAFRSAIDALVTQPALYRQMSRCGYNKAMIFFDSAINSRQVVNLYEQKLAAM